MHCGGQFTVFSTLTNSSTNGAQGKVERRGAGGTQLEGTGKLRIVKDPPVSHNERVREKLKPTVWQETVPGLGERSTAGPGQFA